MKLASNFPGQQKCYLMKRAAMHWIPSLLLTAGAFAEPGGIYLNNLTQEYDGALKFPLVSTDPPGLPVEFRIYPRSQSDVVYQTHPDIAQPSYQSYGIEGKVDKALGDLIFLGEGNRRLESIDVTMVNWAESADWPTLTSENSKGYLHPLTIIVYSVSGESLTLLGQKTEQFLVPWKPSVLADGGEYPYGGIAFKARFDFIDKINLTEKIAVLVGYNTGTSGFAPIGTKGPYNLLNVATSKTPPTTGRDDHKWRMLRYVENVSISKSFGKYAPMFTVRAFPEEPARGTPLDSGGYLVEAQIADEVYTGETAKNLRVTPLTAAVILSGMRQAADGTTREVSAQTNPSGLSFDTVYARRTEPPTTRGTYPVFVSLKSTNYVGQSSGLMRLGHSYGSWMSEQASGGLIPASLRGRNDDPDSDGFSNVQEYAFATHPGISSEKPTKLLKISGSDNSRMITFVKNNEATDLDYILEKTSDLNDPNGWKIVPLPAEDLFQPRPIDLLELPFPVQGDKNFKFVRLGIRY